MRLRDDEVWRIEIEFDYRELVRNNHESYIINWFDKTQKVVTSERVLYAVRGMAQALNDVAVLSSINKVKSIKIGTFNH